MSDSLWPCGLQHTRLPCPSPTTGACSNSYPSSQWCYPTISSSVVPFSSCLQSFPASGSFPMSQFFTSGGQSIGASVSASVLPMNIQYWFPFEISLVWSPFRPRDSQESSPTRQLKSISCLALSFLYGPTLTSMHDYWKNHSFDSVGKVMSLFFNMLSRFVSFYSKEPATFNFMAAVTICCDFEAQENKVYHCFHCFSIYLPWSDGTGCHDLRFLNLSFKLTFHSPLSLSSRGFWVPLHFLP